MVSSVFAKVFRWIIAPISACFGAQAVLEHDENDLSRSSFQPPQARRPSDTPRLESKGRQPGAHLTPLSEKDPLLDAQRAYSYGHSARRTIQPANSMLGGSPVSSLRTKCSAVFSDSSTQVADSSPVKQRRPLPHHKSLMRINSAAFFHGVKEPVCIVHPPPDEDVNVESVDVPMFTDQLFSSPSEMSFWEYPIYPDSDDPDRGLAPRLPRPHRISLRSRSSSGQSWADDVGSTSYAPSSM